MAGWAAWLGSIEFGPRFCHCLLHSRLDSIKRLFGRVGRLREELLQRRPSLSSLPLGAEDQAHQQSVSMRHRLGTIAKGDLAHDHTASQRLLRLIISRLNLRMIHKGEQAITLLAQAAAQLFGRFPRQVLGRQTAQPLLQVPLYLWGRFEPE